MSRTKIKPARDHNALAVIHRFIISCDRPYGLQQKSPFTMIREGAFCIAFRPLPLFLQFGDLFIP